MEHKRGDTLSFLINLVDDNNQPLDLEVTQIRSQMRNSVNKLIDEFTVTKTETIGEYLFEAQADTNTYPLSTLYSDIEINEDGIIASSETFEIEIVKDITQNGNA
jgi:hypothetical protein